MKTVHLNGKMNNVTNVNNRLLDENLNKHNIKEPNIYTHMKTVHQNDKKINVKNKKTSFSKVDLNLHIRKKHNQSKQRKNRKFKKRSNESELSIKNYTDYQFGNGVNDLLQKGRMFIPNPNINKTELLKSFIQMERKLRIIWHHYKTDVEHGVEEYKED